MTRKFCDMCDKIALQTYPQSSVAITWHSSGVDMLGTIKGSMSFYNTADSAGQYKPLDLCASCYNRLCEEMKVKV